MLLFWMGLHGQRHGRRGGGQQNQFPQEPQEEHGDRLRHELALDLHLLSERTDHPGPRGVRQPEPSAASVLHRERAERLRRALRCVHQERLRLRLADLGPDQRLHL